jgi:hypothetical protein
VPPNYEEQDVFPQQVTNGFSNPTLQSVMPNKLRKSTAPTLGTKINLDDFDEEINGINLSKLFTAYGPVTQTTGGARIHPPIANGAMR